MNANTPEGYAEDANLLAHASLIVREDHARIARAAAAGILTGADLDFDLELDRACQEVCEAFRARFHPSTERVYAGVYAGEVEVWTVGPVELVHTAALTAVSA